MCINYSSHSYDVATVLWILQDVLGFTLLGWWNSNKHVINLLNMHKAYADKCFEQKIEKNIVIITTKF